MLKYGSVTKATYLALRLEFNKINHYIKMSQLLSYNIISLCLFCIYFIVFIICGILMKVVEYNYKLKNLYNTIEYTTHSRFVNH